MMRLHCYCILLASLTGLARVSGDTPNILLIMSEGAQASDFFEPNGDIAPLQVQKDSKMYTVPTPAIDRLIAEGTTFSKFYVTSPKCTPSRFSFLTGRLPSKSKMALERTLKAFGETMLPDIQVSTTKFQGTDLTSNLQTVLKNELDYMTGHVGKWHLSETSDSWGDYDASQSLVRSSGFEYVDGLYMSNIGNDGTPPHNTEWMAWAALEFLEQAKQANKPFFLQYNPILPNMGGVWDALTVQGTEVMTPAGNLSSAPVVSGMRSRAELIAKTNELINADNSPFRADKSENRIAGLLWMDDQVGAVLDALEHDGRLENTLVIFSSDHGANGKGHPYEVATRVPFFVRFPESFGASEVKKQLVSNLDVVPTVLDLCGLSGNELATLADGSSLIRSNLSTRRITIEIGYDRAVLDGNFSYIYKPQEVFSNSAQQSVGTVANEYPSFYQWEQLYDMLSDEMQQINLACDSNYWESLESLKGELACNTRGLHAAVIPHNILIANGIISDSAKVVLPSVCRGMFENNAEIEPPLCNASDLPSIPITPPTRSPTVKNAHDGVKTNLETQTDGPELQSPTQLRSVDGILYVNLTVSARRISLGWLSFTSRVYSTETHDPSLVGPTLIVQPGDILIVELINDLGTESESDTVMEQYSDMNRMHGLNSTNLHTHGLHVDPHIDSIFVRVGPGQRHKYEIPIPASHAPGLHWYHSHKHGATTSHIMGGLVGAIIVEPKSGEMFPIPFQDRTVAVLGHLKFDTRDDPNENKDLDFQFETYSHTYIEEVAGGTLSFEPEFSPYSYQPCLEPHCINRTDVYTVNGYYQPSVTMTTADTKVFELVNAGSGGHALELEIGSHIGNETSEAACNWWILAMDGVTLEKPRSMQNRKMIAMVQAGRLVIALQCPTPGTYFFQSNGAAARAGGLQPDISRYTQNLFTLKVSYSESAPASIPSSLKTPGDIWPSYLSDLRNTSSVEATWELSVDNTEKEADKFLMGIGDYCRLPCGGAGGCTDEGPSHEDCTYQYFPGQQGSPVAEDFSGFYGHIGKVGTVEELIINGRSGGNHPMHIHVNHFQIIDFEPTFGGGSYNIEHWFEIGDWRDTVPAIPGRLKVRYHAHEFDGETIVHCHILRHEDTGMMGQFYLVKPDEFDKVPSKDTMFNNLGCSDSELADGLNDEQFNDANIIASKGFSFLSGGITNDAWLPPGKTAVFFGFQSFRYEDNGGSISPGDARKVGEFVLSTLTASQVEDFCEMVQGTSEEYEMIHQRRAQIVSRIHQIKVQQGSGNNLETLADEIEALDRMLYAVDGQVALTYANTFGSLQLSQSQLSKFDDLFNGQINLTLPDGFKSKNLCSGDLEFAKHNIGSVASELFAWYVGQEDWVKYIAEGKIANTFGFMQLRQYDRSTGGVGGDRGAMSDLFKAQLNRKGCSALKELALDSYALNLEYQLAHSDLALELRKLRFANTSPSFKEKRVHDLAARIGEIDGQLVSKQALFFSDISNYKGSMEAVTRELEFKRYPDGHPGPIFPACDSPIDVDHAVFSLSCQQNILPGQQCNVTCIDSNLPSKAGCYEFEDESRWYTECSLDFSRDEISTTAIKSVSETVSAYVIVLLVHIVFILK